MRYGFDSILACRALDGNLVGSPFDSRLNPLPNQPKIPRQIRKLLSRALIHIIIDISFLCARSGKERGPTSFVCRFDNRLLAQENRRLLLEIVSIHHLAPLGETLRCMAGVTCFLGTLRTKEMQLCCTVFGLMAVSVAQWTNQVFLASMFCDVSEIQV